MAEARREHLPWYVWQLIPLALPYVTVVMLMLLFRIGESTTQSFSFAGVVGDGDWLNCEQVRRDAGSKTG